MEGRIVRWLVGWLADEGSLSPGCSKRFPVRSLTLNQDNPPPRIQRATNLSSPQRHAHTTSHERTLKCDANNAYLLLLMLLLPRCPGACDGKFRRKNDCFYSRVFSQLCFRCRSERETGRGIYWALVDHSFSSPVRKDSHPPKRWTCPINDKKRETNNKNSNKSQWSPTEILFTRISPLHIPHHDYQDLFYHFHLNTGKNNSHRFISIARVFRLDHHGSNLMGSWLEHASWILQLISSWILNRITSWANNIFLTRVMGNFISFKIYWTL